MISCFIVVKCIDDEVKLAEETKAKSIFLDFSNIVFYNDLAILSTNCFFQSFTLRHVDMLSSEEELSV